MPWIRNEWLWDDLQRNWAVLDTCLRNRPETDESVVELMAAWENHQWYVWPSLVLGIPPHDGSYLISFHKEVQK